MKKSKGWMKICTIAMSIVVLLSGGIGTGLWITYGGGGLSQTEITSEEEFSENDQNSDDSSENVDNSDDLSTGEDDSDEGSDNGNNGSSGGSENGGSGEETDDSDGNSSPSGGSDDDETSSSGESGNNSNSGSSGTESGTGETKDESSGSGNNSGESDGALSTMEADIELGVYSDLTDSDGNEVLYWISDSSYMSDSWSGNGTSDDPYLIESAEDLALLSYGVFNGETYQNTYFEQTANINLSGTEYNENGLYWMPIGGHCIDGQSTSYTFIGKYNGGGYIISNLTTFYGSDNTMYNYAGLFGYVHGKITSNDIAYVANRADVSNITLVDSLVQGYNYVGGIMGYGQSGCYIQYCYNGATITGNQFVGGIIGYQTSYSTLDYCFNGADVIGDTYVGGIIGRIWYLSMHWCYNFGSVIGTKAVGGLAGWAYNSVGIHGNFNIGSVTGETYVAGLVGYDTNGMANYGWNFYGGYCDDIGAIGYGADEDGNVLYSEPTDLDGASYCEDILSLIACGEWLTDETIWGSDYVWDFSDIWVQYKMLNSGLPFFPWQMSLWLDYDGEAWTFEYGEIPQTYCGSSSPSDVGELSSTFDLSISATTFAEVNVYFGDVDYAQVNIFNISDTEKTNVLASGWFLMEKVVWVVSYEEECPETFSVVVSKNVVVYGSLTNLNSSDWNWSEASILSDLAGFDALTDFAWLNESEWTYDAFTSSTSQAVVSSGATSASSILSVASVEEIDALGGSYRSTCTDFVAFLMSGGSSTTGGSRTEYWTRSLSVSLDSSTYYGAKYGASSYKGAYNNGVYVTSFGTLSNGWLTNYFGARLSICI